MRQPHGRDSQLSRAGCNHTTEQQFFVGGSRLLFIFTDPEIFESKCDRRILESRDINPQMPREVNISLCPARGIIPKGVVPPRRERSHFPDVRSCEPDITESFVYGFRYHFRRDGFFSH